MRERNIHVIGGSPVPSLFPPEDGNFQINTAKSISAGFPICHFLSICSYVHLCSCPIKPSQIRQLGASPPTRPLPSFPRRISPARVSQLESACESTTRLAADPHRHRRLQKRLLLLSFVRRMSPRRWDDNQRRVQRRLRARFAGQQIFGLAVRS